MKLFKMIFQNFIFISLSTILLQSHVSSLPEESALTSDENYDYYNYDLEEDTPKEKPEKVDITESKDDSDLTFYEDDEDVAVEEVAEPTVASIKLNSGKEENNSKEFDEKLYEDYYAELESILDKYDEQESENGEHNDKKTNVEKGIDSLLGLLAGNDKEEIIEPSSEPIIDEDAKKENSEEEKKIKEQLEYYDNLYDEIKNEDYEKPEISPEVTESIKEKTHDNESEEETVKIPDNKPEINQEEFNSDKKPNEALTEKSEANHITNIVILLVFGVMIMIGVLVYWIQVYSNKKSPVGEYSDIEATAGKSVQ